MPDCVVIFMQLMLTRARAGPLQEADLPAGVLLSTVVDSPVARYACSCQHARTPAQSAKHATLCETAARVQHSH
jgi:hypothetical protein